MSAGLRIGVDIGGTKTLAVAVDPEGRVLDQVRRASGFGTEEVVAAAVDAVATLRARLPAADVASIGVGIPGTVEHLSGEVRHALNLGLAHVQLGEILGAHFGTRVYVENDVNAAALGALHLLTGFTDNGTLAYLNLGTGLAAGVVLGGRLWRGVSGTAGEIGHVPLDPSGPACVCGQRGCLELFASGSGIARQWGGAAPSGPELLELAHRGDSRATGILDDLVWAVASAVRLLALTHDVERLVIGGGFAEALGTDLMDPVVKRLLEWEASSAFLASVAVSARVVLAPPDLPIAAIGAAFSATDSADGSSRG